MEKEDRCFFCDYLIIPNSMIFNIEEIQNYFNNLQIPFSLEYNISRFTIGNKKICLKCEADLKNVVFSNNKFND